MSIPFRAIHYFVEVARSQSFSKASLRLHVSQSAVSHQIKILEDYLGASLFVRRGRDIVLTAIGENYFHQVADALDSIESASRFLRNYDTREVRLALHGSLAVKWLIPALNEFRQRYPNINLSLQMLTEDGDFDDAWADCFITTKPPTSGFQRYHLYDERLKPYCAKEIWTEAQRFQSPDELVKFPLLSATSAFASHKPGADWKAWFEQGGCHLPADAQIHHFSHLLLAAEAAKYGQGIALLNEFMTTAEEREHSLFELPMHSIKTDDSFYFVYPGAASRNPGLVALGEWLVALCREKSASVA